MIPLLLTICKNLTDGPTSAGNSFIMAIFCQLGSKIVQCLTLSSHFRSAEFNLAKFLIKILIMTIIINQNYYCSIQLGNGEQGTDVRVRNNRLHCQNCYSNDEGKLFIKHSCLWFGTFFLTCSLIILRLPLIVYRPTQLFV